MSRPRSGGSWTAEFGLGLREYRRPSAPVPSRTDAMVVNRAKPCTQSEFRSSGADAEPVRSAPNSGDNDRVHRTTSRDCWAVVVPLKGSARGKSRIDVDPVLRRRLAVAMAMDTVAAASAADRVGDVLVVAEDRTDGDRLSQIPGVRILLTRRSGLNEAIEDGLRSLGHDGPVAVLPGDLPSLTPGELDGALGASRAHRHAVVADRQGTGTTLLTASSGAVLRPRYGAGSLARHLAAGAELLELPVQSGLRRDVDKVVDLVGVSGDRSVALLAEAGWAPLLWAARSAG